MEENGKKGKKSMNYKNAKIYKLVSNLTNKIYIGSTCRDLRKRFHEHKRHYHLFLKKQKNYLTSYELMKLGDCDIILIENYPCKEKAELHARERFHIETNRAICVYIMTPTQTCPEYRQKHIEEIKAYDRKRCKTAERKAYALEKFDCDCGGRYTRSDKAKHMKTEKHKQYINELDA